MGSESSNVQKSDTQLEKEINFPPAAKRANIQDFYDYSADFEIKPHKMPGEKGYKSGGVIADPYR